jgi:hypothetical protein
MSRLGQHRRKDRDGAGAAGGRPQAQSPARERRTRRRAAAPLADDGPVGRPGGRQLVGGGTGDRGILGASEPAEKQDEDADDAGADENAW